MKSSANKASNKTHGQPSCSSCSKISPRCWQQTARAACNRVGDGRLQRYFLQITTTNGNKQRSFQNPLQREIDPIFCLALNIVTHNNNSSNIWRKTTKQSTKQCGFVSLRRQFNGNCQSYEAVCFRFFWRTESFDQLWGNLRSRKVSHNGSRLLHLFFLSSVKKKKLMVWLNLTQCWSRNLLSKNRNFTWRMRISVS